MAKNKNQHMNNNQNQTADTEFAGETSVVRSNKRSSKAKNQNMNKF